MKLERDKKYEVCPKCISSDIAYEHRFDGTDRYTCDITCESCGYEWEEWYSVTFIGSYES